MCKNYVIFWGGGGEVIKRLHWITGGRGGGLGGPKKDYVIFEWSLKCIQLDNENNFRGGVTKFFLKIGGKS